VKNLDAYLNDHLAGAVVALELIDHRRGEHKDERVGKLFESLKADIDADKETLREVMRSFGIEESTVRQTGAWVAEKVGRARLKIAGDEPGLVLALEGLIMGISGKRMLWPSLALANAPNTSKWDFERYSAGRKIKSNEQKPNGFGRRSGLSSAGAVRTDFQWA
jgi:hypothetical protein